MHEAYDLKSTPAEKDITHNGAAILIIKNGTPVTLIYSPDPAKTFSSSVIRIDPDNADEIERTTVVLSGAVHGTRFIRSGQLFPQNKPSNQPTNQ